MSSASRYAEWHTRAALFVLAAAVVLCVGQVVSVIRLPEPAVPAVPAGAADLSSAPVADLAALDWNRFRQGAGAPSPEAGALARRFRLAGTFSYESEAGAEMRKAILDDLKQKTEHIVSENERVEDVLVARIFQDRVVLRQGNTEEELWLSFARPGSESDGADAGSGVPGDPGPYGGVQLADKRWVFQRDSLMDYYNELRNEPERLVTVFDSMKPVYDDDRRITGYELDVVGERDFFNAVGLREGDVVRSVDSMRMSSRRRAEYFIREFVRGRANAFVLEVDREGETQKLIYQVR